MAADVRVVRDDDRKRNTAAIRKYRMEHEQVGQMHSAAIRIVQ